MDQIRVEQSFVLYARCQVLYDGRANSTLESGNYLITHKNDGTLKIDGGTLCNPLNYQPPGAILLKHGNTLISTRKKETIKIIVDSIHFYRELKDWSTNKIKISKTEAQLRSKIAAKVDNILSIESIEVYEEFKTPVGDIDVLAIDKNNVYHVIEVKRGKASLATCSQLKRYCGYFASVVDNYKGYIASPEISKNALTHAENSEQTYLKVDHSI